MYFIQSGQPLSQTVSASGPEMPDWDEEAVLTELLPIERSLTDCGLCNIFAESH